MFLGFSSLFHVCRSSPSLGVRCTPMWRPAARPAACPLPASTWVETPPCWSVTCCWPTPGNTTVKSRLEESTTGARSTSSCWVSVVTELGLWGDPNPFVHIFIYLCTDAHRRPSHRVISLAHFLRHADRPNDSIRFRRCDLIWCSCCLGSFGLARWWGETRDMSTGSGGAGLIMFWVTQKRRKDKCVMCRCTFPLWDKQTRL